MFCFSYESPSSLNYRLVVSRVLRASIVVILFVFTGSYGLPALLTELYCMNVNVRSDSLLAVLSPPTMGTESADGEYLNGHHMPSVLALISFVCR